MRDSEGGTVAAASIDESPTAKAGRILDARRGGWKQWLRGIHRDLGCIALGLTFVYALSGIAVNHIKDWNPNFSEDTTTHTLKPGYPKAASALVPHVLDELGITASPVDPLRPWNEPFGPGKTIEVTFPGNALLVIDPDAGTVVESTQSPRFMLRAMNWLHVQRGKPGWNLIGDSYAVVLMVLAVSGLFLLPKGRKGLLGRGGLLVLLGILIPMLYLALSGGPAGPHGDGAIEMPAEGAKE